MHFQGLDGTSTDGGWLDGVRRGWRSPPCAPDGMVGVGKGLRRKKVTGKVADGYKAFMGVGLFQKSLCSGQWEKGQVLERQMGDGWDPSFSRPLNDLEIEMVECFLSRIQDKAVIEEREDEVFWAVTKSGSFSVKSLYSILEEVRISRFPTSIVWNTWVPPKPIAAPFVMLMSQLTIYSCIVGALVLFVQDVVNFWGYSTVNYFSPMIRYSSAGIHNCGHDALNEVKLLMREAHKRGIEVLMDVVFNHTAEGNENGPILSFRGVDNSVYYMLAPKGEFYNYSGCGNTFNCNHPIVRQFILDCLRCVCMGVSGGVPAQCTSTSEGDSLTTGTPLSSPPLIDMISNDPILRGVKLIAEAWDAGGLYQVGMFPHWGLWSEWNGKYRDIVRQFIKGSDGFLGLLLNAFVGALICTRYVWVSPGKWLRFLKEQNSLWYSVVKRKWGGLEERGSTKQVADFLAKRGTSISSPSPVNAVILIYREELSVNAHEYFFGCPVGFLPFPIKGSLLLLFFSYKRCNSLFGGLDRQIRISFPSSPVNAEGGRKPWNSINFVCAHDGFTLADLVTYNKKHNNANGEDNNDGENHNNSWNCGQNQQHSSTYWEHS
ncbi:Isoamylase 1, chloroplastic [Vitis vinifera]|uniref:Isoamylase 1, chloroplastic n=1 Tax=Vitis vinifera TaxID=29760 RepID=A0A438CXP0_VITVI|nr:Isoamylase 1, chloroplastic [Vitis vinifera]